jgi:alpha-tubulin suppressor-like RCC1 family protein
MLVDAAGNRVPGVLLTATSATGVSTSHGACTSTLSGVTDDVGFAHLTFCPTKSGSWVVSGDGVTSSPALPLVLPIAPTQMSSGGSHTCGRMPNGTVECAGELNQYGEVGVGPRFFDVYRPTTVPGLTGVGAVGAGGHFTCALLTPGASGKVKCWGAGASGQIGNGKKYIAQPVPQMVMASAKAPLNGVASISVGDRTACAVVNPGLNGTAWCWGENSLGQAGDGTVVDKVRPSPVKVNATTVLKGVSRISVGQVSTCALMVNNAVRCWGYNAAGMLGTGNTVNLRYASKPVVGVDGVTGKATIVSVGYSSACARLTNGTVRCWGYDHDGQLGNGTYTGPLAFPFSATPVVVRNGSASVLTGVTGLVVGYGGACVIVGTGSTARMKCWGLGGIIGIGDFAQHDYPVLVPNVVGVKAIYSGSTTIALVPSTLRAPAMYLGWGTRSAIAGEPVLPNPNKPSILTLW